MKTTTASKRCILSLSLSVAAALAWAAPALAQHDHGKGQPSDQHAHGDAAKATYFCPMHCEGAKTYAEPGKCPKCGMNLKKQTTDTFSMEIKPLGGVITVGKPATEKQVKAIHAIGHKLGLTDAVLHDTSHERYGHGISQLSIKEAMDFIDALQKQIEADGGAK